VHRDSSFRLWSRYHKNRISISTLSRNAAFLKSQISNLKSLAPRPIIKASRCLHPWNLFPFPSTALLNAAPLSRAAPHRLAASLARRVPPPPLPPSPGTPGEGRGEGLPSSTALLITVLLSRAAPPLSPSPGTPGEGRGGGSFSFASIKRYTLGNGTQCSNRARNPAM
jgi:hypothetical protein